MESAVALGAGTVWLLQLPLNMAPPMVGGSVVKAKVGEGCLDVYTASGPSG